MTNSWFSASLSWYPSMQPVSTVGVTFKNMLKESTQRRLWWMNFSLNNLYSLEQGEKEHLCVDVNKTQPNVIPVVLKFNFILILWKIKLSIQSCNWKNKKAKMSPEEKPLTNDERKTNSGWGRTTSRERFVQNTTLTANPLLICEWKWSWIRCTSVRRRQNSPGGFLLVKESCSLCQLKEHGAGLMN